MTEQFIRNCWYVAAWDDELTPGKLFPITICDVPLVLYRTEGGEIVVLEDRCCHRMAPLSLGRIEDGCNLRCMYHGLKFDTAGKCIEIPGQDKIPATAKVARFASAVRYGWVWVWLGDAATADIAALPKAPHEPGEGYIYRRGHLDYDANYELLNDNLTDFSHLSYVHAVSFKATDVWAETRPEVKAIDRGIRVTRWFGPERSPLKSDSQSTERLQGGPASFAMYQTYDYLAPGILLMYSSFHNPDIVPDPRPSGADLPPLSIRIDLQAVTPMSQKRTRYFFNAAVREMDGGEAMADRTLTTTEMAFAEDRAMIEGQQRILDLRPGNEMLTTADVGPVQFRAALRRLRAAEAKKETVSA